MGILGEIVELFILPVIFSFKKDNLFFNQKAQAVTSLLVLLNGKAKKGHKTLPLIYFAMPNFAALYL